MISVSTIKGLLLANKYDECFKIMGQHFEGTDSSDIVAAGKVLGLVSLQCLLRTIIYWLKNQSIFKFFSKKIQIFCNLLSNCFIFLRSVLTAITWMRVLLRKVSTVWSSSSSKASTALSNKSRKWQKKTLKKDLKISST